MQFPDIFMNLPVRNSRIKLSQGKLFWREVGKGPTLVFLHGAWHDGNQWLPVIDSLSGKYHCLAPDLLGFGESDRPDVHYSIHLEVECLAEYLETLNLKKIYLVGDGVGGWIAASYALRYPEKVGGLVLLAPEGVQVDGARRNLWWLRWLLDRPKVVDWLWHWLPILKKRKFPGWLSKIKDLLPRLEQILESPAACQLLFQRRKSEIEAELLEEKLPWLKKPVLILQGEQDSSTAVALNKAYAQMLPNAQVKILPNGESALSQQLPEEVANYIHEFVLRH
ncbi:MAG TPA: alpha/beta hydrolase [Leptolyngbyaceae cyanobacterium]